MTDSKNITPEMADDKASLFLGLMGSPFESDWTTSVFRMLSSVLAKGHPVTVWTCGYSTQITQTTNVRTADPIHPESTCEHCHSLTDMAQALLDDYPDQLQWYVCEYCMEERGAIHQIEQTETRLPFSFNTYLLQADKRLVFGIK